MSLVLLIEGRMELQLIVMFLTTAFLTGLVRQYTLSRHVLDIPNARSSHTVPTPRGGGVAFVLTTLLVLCYLGFSGQMDQWFTLGAVSGCSLVAGLGWIDDHRSLHAKWRLLGHFISASFALYCMGGMTSAVFLEAHCLYVSTLTFIFALLYLIWFLNLFNFMDGINGLASAEAITICCGGALIYGMQGYASMTMFPLMLAAGVAGFMVWNFPVARLFMGDVGSGFLGFLIGLLSIQAANVQASFFWSWVILSGVFIVDATMTLLRRLFKGERIDEAHRQHAYQCSADQFASHVKVTCAVILINLLWLLPTAVLVGVGRLNGMVGVLIAYAPLVILGQQFQTKRRE